MPQVRTRVAKDEFFELMEAQRIALSYDEVRLKSGRQTSTIMPDQVSTVSLFSRNVPLNIPFVSAAMDTVTEADMAIEMARLGGLGIIHKNFEPKQQAAIVSSVKFSQNGLITTPKTVKKSDTLAEILTRFETKRYAFRTIPVLDDGGKVAGVLSENDFKFCDDLSLRAEDVMTNNVMTAPAGTEIDEAYKLMVEAKKGMLPLIDDRGKLVGLYVWSDLRRIKSGRSQINNIDARGQLRVGAAIGVGKEALDRVERLFAKNVDVVVIDTAHADSQPVIDTLLAIKNTDPYRDLDVVVGNISQPESALRLLKAGADGLKIGQGPGAICTTRIIAGYGAPQFTAVYKCSVVADEYGVPVCADGGIAQTGDVPVALGAGALSVMMGSAFAGTDEAPGEVQNHQGRLWKQYRGMGSMSAMLARKGSRERYGQAEGGKNEMIPEGVEGRVPYKGPLKKTMFQYVGGLKRGMGAVGAATIQELRDLADFDRMSAAGQKESHPHDIVITEDAPNYQVGGE